MAVDTKRVQAIYLTALEATDADDQAAILDRECMSDVEMRQHVEALLVEHRDSPTIVNPLAPGPLESVLAPAEGVTTSKFTIVEQEALVPAAQTAAVVEGDDSEEDQPPLDFLQPSTSPGSLGRLGHHEVLEVLGRGGFGIVVRAFDETLQRVVAIKVLAPQLASTSPVRKRFLREARASARVRHEYVVQIYAVEEQPLPYLVMEYIPGQTLQQRLEHCGPLEVSDVLRIGAQIAHGLAAAHDQGLIHRDIKPGNILLESGVVPKVKITDFGLARAADDASLTQSGVIAGTPLFMAPEQANGEPPDPRADLFSLGSVLYTMTSGRPPFRAASTLAVLKRVAEDTPRPIRQIIPEVPQWLCDLIAKLHAKDPARRFQTAAEVAVLLEQHLAHLQDPSLMKQPPTGKSAEKHAPRRVAVLVAAAAALAALAAGVTYPQWRTTGSMPVAATGPVGPGNSDAQARTSPEAPVKPSVAKPPRIYVLQGRTAVRDAVIDFLEPDRKSGPAPRDNALRRADQCSAFLVHFDLAKLEVPPKSRVTKATASFFVWDPSSSGRSKVCAFPLKTAWDETEASWREPAAGKAWQGGRSFAFDADAGPPGPGTIVEPEQGNDTADPPIEYQLDVTEMVRSWLEDGTPNHGMAFASVIDPSVDEGQLTRFQIYSSEHSREQYTPKLTVLVQQ